MFFFPHRRQKEVQKALETPEQRRQRRLQKKEEKEKKFDRLKGVDELGYTNTDNPFGDTRLTESFVWSKVCYLLFLFFSDPNISEAFRKRTFKEKS